MSNTLAMAAQLAGQSLRFGWYFALNRALDWRTDQLGRTPRYQPARPVPSLQELLAERAQLLMSDALNVREGLYPPMDDDAASPLRHLARVRQMFADMPHAYARRTGRCHHGQGGRPPRRCRRTRGSPDRRVSEPRCSWGLPGRCGAPRSPPSPSSCTGGTSAR
jgi:hypothetical protein